MSAPTLATPDENRLREMVEHVNYELKLFRQSDQYLRRLKPDLSAADTHLFNAVLNDYVVHLRCLYSFFFATQKPAKDERRPKWHRPSREPMDEWDCIAADYVPGGWLCKEVPLVLSERYTAMNRLLAHVSYWRTKNKDDWELHKLTPAMAEVVTAFFDELPEDRRSWFDEATHDEFWRNTDALREEPLVLSSPVSTVDAHRPQT